MGPPVNRDVTNQIDILAIRNHPGANCFANDNIQFTNRESRNIPSDSIEKNVSIIKIVFMINL